MTSSSVAPASLHWKISAKSSVETAGFCSVATMEPSGQPTEEHQLCSVDIKNSVYVNMYNFTYGWESAWQASSSFPY